MSDSADCEHLRSALASSDALHDLGDSAQDTYGSILSPLFKALSAHRGSRWNPDPKKRMKPEYKYIKYITELYKKPSRVERSLDGSNLYNTVRLMKPRDECLDQSKEFFMQDLSYNLDRVRNEEQLLKSVLLYSFDHRASVTSVCYLNIKQQENSNQCQLCPGAHHTVNFTVKANQRRRGNWVEADVTSFLQPLLKFQKKHVHLLINVTCPEDRRARGGGHKGLVQLTLRSPPLLLYLNDTKKTVHRRPPVSAKAGERPAANTFYKRTELKPEGRIGGMAECKKRLRRESPKNKKSDQSLDMHLPDLLPSTEFPTSDCALYDFRVRFSQLKLDHWIVFPPKYNPRYCRGTCPRTMGFIYGSPVHTMVQNIIYEKLDSSVPRPSCIPSHYSPLSVMIFEEDGSYVYKEFEDMVATRCTCR
ncbi:growth/differentiatio [Diretmus argenteus]